MLPRRAGIGINAGRNEESMLKLEVEKSQHTGVIPKKFESTVRCCTQNGVRGGTMTVHFSYGTQEIEDILVLKNNKGTEDNRVRKLDYPNTNIQTVHERFINEEDIFCFP